MLALHAVCCVQAPERLDCSGIIGRSISTTNLASPFAATIDLARSGRLSSTGGSGMGPGLGSALPPKPRGIERRAATELPTIPSGAVHACSKTPACLSTMSMLSERLQLSAFIDGLAAGRQGSVIKGKHSLLLR